MLSIRRVLPIIIIAMTIAAALTLISSGGRSADQPEHGTGPATLAPVPAPAGFPIMDECLPGNPEYRMFSPEWGESHRKKIEGDVPTGCSQQECYACHISAYPHMDITSGNHASVYNKKVDPEGKTPEEIKKQKQEIREKRESCYDCHDYSSCNGCHQANKGHTGDMKFPGHGKFLEGITTASCAACHKVGFCNDCHEERGDAIVPLGENYVQTHPMFVQRGMTAREGAPVCSDCHTRYYCYSCHSGGDVHPDRWVYRHSDRMDEIADGAEMLEEDHCESCHKAEYCQNCHSREGMMGSDHPDKWEQTHADVPESKTSLCVTCHSPGYCSSCHDGLQLPHGEEFAENHKEQAEELTETCASCHEPDLGLSCHIRGIREPGTHAAGDWYRNHSNLAGMSEDFCKLCHDPDKFCSMCHDVSSARVSHAEKWPEQHVATKGLEEIEGCGHCHDMPYCMECHSDIESQAGQETPDHRMCSRCHTADDEWTFAGASVCADCHEDISEENNLSEDKFDCTMCHEPHKWEITSKQVCSSCHREEAAQISDDHSSDNCSACHKAHKWHDPLVFDTCSSSGCHEWDTSVVDYSNLHTIGAHGRCGDCHREHTFAQYQPESCLKCHRDLPEDCHMEDRSTCTGSGCHSFK